MTRSEFNARYAVKIENTEGFTTTDIKWINDYLCNLIEEVDGDDDTARDTVENKFVEAECALWAHKERVGF